MKPTQSSFTALSDEQLMQQCTKGERIAFEILYERYSEKLLRFASRLLYDRQKAEDILQEVFIRIIEKPEYFDGDKKFSTWAYTITANLCKNVLRDEQNRKRLLNQEAAFQDEQTFSHSQVDYQLLKQKLQSVYTTLSEKEKQLFVLRFEHELPLKDIANIINIPEGSVKSGLFYMLRKLSQQLKHFTHEK